MLKKLGSDVLGLSDIGRIVPKDEFNKTDIDDYILTEDNEEIFFVIKSRSDEYCFTNLGFLHLDGNSAVSKKRNLKRYDYYYHHINNVQLETAGAIDLDVEIHFNMGNQAFKIDVKKDQIESLKDLYKALYRISMIQNQNQEKMNMSLQAQELSSKYLEQGRLNTGTGEETLSVFESLRKSSEAYLFEKHDEYFLTDFGNVFKKYINN